MNAELPVIDKFLRDETKDNLLIYEVNILFSLS
jgi:hypothetical protein